MSYAIIIPARYESSRLPGKPLVDLDGVPMIVRTWRQCTKAVAASSIYVATDDKRIEAVCSSYGIQSIFTSRDCLTGTDRVAECARQLEAEVFINVQGDEPVFNPEDLLRLIDASLEYPEEVLNGVCEIHDEVHFRSGSIPKVVMGPEGRLLYMSRAAIPSTKGHNYVKAWRQVCAYAFPRAALEIFVSQRNKTPMEQIEDIEVLRFLELGIQVRMIKLSEDSIAVDLPEDVETVIAAIRERGL
jgi:3-deoxy-manno-octulosonate cytidylyltransferase (CMP-KDO synthetase)